MSRTQGNVRETISAWSEGYFLLDEEGFVRVRPEADAPSVALQSIIDGLRARGFRSPFLLRFPQILRHRARRLREGFASAIQEFDYPSRYQGVYPVKVNQQRVVLEALVAEGRGHGFGLEVGSKAELVQALAHELDPDALVICNGFKDRDYLELAARASCRIPGVTVIAETPREIGELLAVGAEVGRLPRVGVRAKLDAAGVGRWQESTGVRAKFGLSTSEILEVVDSLEAAGKLDSLSCVHFHCGSQIGDIRAIKECVREAARLYAHLKRMAPSLGYLDLGGGLAVDYDGSRTASDWSRNYDLEEYCRDCVYHVQEICEQEGVAPPVIVTESGRALSAFHSVLVVTPVKVIGGHRGTAAPEEDESECPQVTQLGHLVDDLQADTARELLNDARLYHEELQQGFKLGMVSLRDRARGEELYAELCARGLELMRGDGDEDEIAAMERVVAPRVVCNFSVFRSAPDSWALGQVFPIHPLEFPANAQVMPATLADITCDSDGRVSNYVAEEGKIRGLIDLPESGNGLNPVGIFLAGAYQDALGALHNLFGTPNEAVIELGESGYEIVQHSRGTRVSDVTRVCGYEAGDLVNLFEDQLGSDEGAEAARYRDCYLRLLNSGTYLRT